MRQAKQQAISQKQRVLGSLIKEAIFILLLFTATCFISIELAFFVATISGSIMVTRRTLNNLNPNFKKDKNSPFRSIDLSDIQKYLDVFELNGPSSLKSLHKYVAVLGGVISPPKILIIRLSEMFPIQPFELYILSDVVNELIKNEITIIFSDVNAVMLHQLELYGIDQKIGEENIFYYLSDGLKRAKEIIH
jgi:SulP family sulfate permease